jgi:hypothetical protein
MGNQTTASGYSATSMGQYTIASGNCTTAMGSYVSTNEKSGACIIGDNSTSTVANSSLANQMTMRFAGGYRLFSNSALTTGVHMDAGVNGWSNICDRNKKENFTPVDGEALLKKIREIHITEWSYKGADPTIRYMGPVAQDFYAEFHLGGTDSLGINTICIDGVNIAAVQALEKRTSELLKANEKITQLEQKIHSLEEKMERLTQLLSLSTTMNQSQIATGTPKEVQ